ncbi:hypothetical protein [Caulobacter sp. 17J80-11]|uniref:hypothetical protein n=1 Tax=Caulobacter sp. 17J80-11 TaxID=2763502 RepID=UPI001653673D|nr:hypothetical protein [Caulobacter sp. 17J80-11]MBC6981375.1 hypothetical protein [Caulobacter sp. 17J80-11]
MADWIGSPPRQLDELTAFDAMRAFLEAYWERGGKRSEDLAILLSSLGRDVWANEMPGDPAMWSDWREAVDSVASKPK